MKLENAIARKEKLEGILVEFQGYFYTGSDRRFIGEQKRSVDYHIRCIEKESMHESEGYDHFAGEFFGFCPEQIESMEADAAAKIRENARSAAVYNKRIENKIISHASNLKESGTIKYEVNGKWYTPKRLYSQIKKLVENKEFHRYVSMPDREVLRNFIRTLGQEKHLSAKQIVYLEDSISRTNRRRKEEKQGVIWLQDPGVCGMYNQYVYTIVNYALETGRVLNMKITVDEMLEFRGNYTDAQGNVDLSPLRLTDFYSSRRTNLTFVKVFDCLEAYLQKANPLHYSFPHGIAKAVPK